MTLSRRTFFKLTGAATISGLVASVPWVGAHPTKAAPNRDALHVLNRATWGATPQDIALIEQIGIGAWLDGQLDWQNIPDPLIDAHLYFYPFLLGTPTEVEAVVAADYGRGEHGFLWSRLYRAANSSRQLYERAVEFWTDHFNIPSPDLLTMKIVDDNTVIRPHALGRFVDLLRASATSPAMLMYLDNAGSYADHPNENYARELMELHTLGVDGGYTEKDVKEVSRILTGWTLNWDAGWPAPYIFNPDLHDWGQKTVLGHVFPEGRGEEEGMELLEFLAAHPSTARFISAKLIRFLVADQPPDALIDSTADVFIRSGGHIPSMLRHIFLSGEFYEHVGTKFRRPTDLLVAMLRALRPGMRLEDSDWLIWELEPLGHTPYRWFPPNGYPHHSMAWINTGALLARWNLAFTMARTDEGWYDGIRFDPDQMCPDATTAGEWVDQAADAILHAPLADSERQWLVDLIGEDMGESRPLDDELRLNRSSTLYGLLMSSPYFQWM